MPNDESFSDLFGKIRPIKHDKIKPIKKPKKIIIHEEITDSAIEKGIAEPCRQLMADDTLFFSRPGVQSNQLRKLRQGKFPIHAELDLHGVTQEIARQQLTQFLAESLANHYRVVRIIHGRGHGSANAMPVLKNLVNNELPSYPTVLAFCSAQPSDGGLGAVYVLLKYFQ